MKRVVERALRSALADIAAKPERLVAVLDDCPHALIAFDTQRTIVASNEAADHYFGYDRHALEGQSVDRLVPPRLRQPDAPPPLATDDLTTVEIPGLRRDGVEIPTVWIFGSASAPGGATS